MKIYSMTATFGKLEHETLTLQPGLNIIEAPNEWGKSTWCAFLTAMLYGLDTRAKSTKTTLADKERYAPWSGSPMAGRIDLNWNGRDITIERKTKRRVPLGEFRAYETASGLDIPELTAANCGQMLLGVERSVFLRSGFIRFSDLPVTQDEALRRRLNALVTTGDESSAADTLAQGLRDLKNRCRYNKSGLLPQAEAERASLEATLRELESSAAQQDTLKSRLEAISLDLKKLENHRAALQYADAQADAARAEAARQTCAEAARRLETAQTACANLPDPEQARSALFELNRLEELLRALDREVQELQPSPKPAEAPALFAGMEPPEAIDAVRADTEHCRALTAGHPLPFLLAAALLIGGGVLAFWMLLPGIAAAVLGLALLTAALVLRGNRKKEAAALVAHYGSPRPEDWMQAAQDYARLRQEEAEALAKDQAVRTDLARRRRELERQLADRTRDRSIEDCRRGWENVLAAWDTLREAQGEHRRCESSLQSVLSMVRTAPPPAMADELDYTPAQMDWLLLDAQAEQHLLQNRLGQAQGRMETLGRADALEEALSKVNRRIAHLEDTYTALTIAQETLAAAAAELQRRFAPRIAHRAQELMGLFTAGRYDRLNLGEDLTVRSGAAQEDTLHEALWRSDGTIDQLYLALRLAVAEALTPDAPLILDDALVRFDDSRLKSAMEVLRKTAENKQVLLFTCHQREKNML